MKLETILKKPLTWILAVVGILLVLKFSIIRTGERIAIIVLGGGLLSDGAVPKHTQFRLDKAVELLKKHTSSSSYVKIITLSGGTTHKPNPLDGDGFPIWEASAAAKRLLEMGVNEDSVMEENFSLDTIGNVFFLRAIHLTPGRFSKVIVITNDWHMPRTKAIFSKVLSLADTVSTYNTVLLSPLFDFEFEQVPAGIDDPEILKARIEKEAGALKSFQQLSSSWSSFEDLHTWLFKDHNAYASKRLSKPRAKIANSALLKTY